MEIKNLEETTRRMHKLVRDPAGEEELEKLKFRAYVDNIRLAKKDAVSVYPVLKRKTKCLYSTIAAFLCSRRPHVERCFSRTSDDTDRITAGSKR